MTMQRWGKQVGRYVKEATAVLKQAGLPTNYEALYSIKPKDRLILNAILIITNSHHLYRESEKGRTDHALNRFFSVVSAYEDFFVLKNVDGYKNGIFLTTEFTRDTEIGVNNRNNMKSAQESRYGTSSQRRERNRQYQDEVNRLHSKNPHRSFTSISNQVGEKFKASGKSVRNNTINPTKQIRKAS